jgi:F-type H+-transporting ATPase subunit gamma
MANVLDLRRRIRSVKNTRQITKAMKMVSAAKLRRAQERAMTARPYAQMLANVLENLVRRTDLFDPTTGEVMHPLLVEREEKNVLVVVIAGDKGFAGGFNSNIGKAAQKFIDERRAGSSSHPPQNVDLEPIGKKAIGLYKKRYPAAVYEHTEEHYDNDLSTHFEDTRRRVAPVEVAKEHPTLLVKSSFDDVTDLANSIVARYERAEIDSVSEEQVEAAAKAAQEAGISVNEPEETEAEQEAKKFGTADVDYIFDQAPERLFRHLMPRYVTTQIFHALLESTAAEHAARMTATDAATKNAGDLIDKLSLTMNRVRQAAITTEIIEIVSGAASV